MRLKRRVTPRLGVKCPTPGVSTFSIFAVGFGVVVLDMVDVLALMGVDILSKGDIHKVGN